MIESVPLRYFVLSAGLLTLFTGAPLSAVEPAPRTTFLFGGDYPSQPKPEISQLFYESGLNAIRLTGGGYAWALPAHLALADEFQKRGLYVYLQLGSHYPDSKFFTMKDAWMVDHKGETGVEDRKAWAISYSGSFWPQYSYTSDEFRRGLEKEFASYVAGFKDEHHVAGVILHNEPGYHWLKDRVFDYSPGSIAKFKIWLEKTHGDIAKLNERWGSNYASFADVVPPGQPPLEGANVPVWLDWRRFHVAAIADFMAWEAAYAKTLRPDIPRTTNLDGSINNWYPYRLADMEAYSRAMDVVGIDIYPSEWTKSVFVPYAMDMAQGVAQGRPVHVMECETFSAKKWKFPEEDRARLLRAQLWSMIGHGAGGVFMWGFSREDDFSLTNGEFNPRLASVRDMAFTAKMIGLEKFRRAPSRVALCVDTDTFLRVSAGDKDGGLAPTTRIDMEVEGYYAALSALGYQVDIVYMEQLKQGVADRYQALILPGTELMDDALAGKLREFVQNGGTLLAAGAFAEADRWNHPAAKIPGNGLDELFGLTVTGPREGEGKMMHDPDLWLDTPIRKVALAGAKAVSTLDDGSPAMTVRSSGKGEAVYLNGRPGNAYFYDGVKLKDLLAKVLGEVKPAAHFQGEGAVDLSALRDGATGNVLMVAATHGQEGKLAPSIGAGRVVLDGQGSYRAAYAFPALRSEGGRMLSGPTLLPVEADGYSLPKLDSALAILLVKGNATPLLAAAAPAEITRQATGDLKITVFNPADQPLTGELALGENSLLGNATPDPVKVSVPPNGSAIYTITFKPLDPTQAIARAPLHALLKRPGQPDLASSPVDVAVK